MRQQFLSLALWEQYLIISLIGAVVWRLGWKVVRGTYRHVRDEIRWKIRCMFMKYVRSSSFTNDIEHTEDKRLKLVLGKEMWVFEKGTVRTSEVVFDLYKILVDTGVSSKKTLVQRVEELEKLLLVKDSNDTDTPKT